MVIVIVIVIVVIIIIIITCQPNTARIYHSTAAA